MDRKPLLLVKLGSNDLGGHYPWVPTADDMRRLQEHLEDKMGEEYHILVYHTGIDIQAVNAEVKQATVEDLKELLRIVEDVQEVVPETETDGYLISGIGTNNEEFLSGALEDVLNDAKLLANRWQVSVEVSDGMKVNPTVIETVHPDMEYRA